MPWTPLRHAYAKQNFNSARQVEYAFLRLLFGYRNRGIAFRCALYASAPYFSPRGCAWRRSTILAFGALCALGAAVARAEPQAGGPRLSAELDWAPAPADLPRGAEVAALYGDPRAPGPFVVRLRARAGYKVGAHRHPDVEMVTVLSGGLRYGEGGRLDPGAEKYLHAGDFFAATPGMGHWIAFNEDSIVQVSGTGPWRIEYLDPRDDPRDKGAARD
jgi:hypothetical protein